ncbi:hypothetical protein AB0395_13175 [Streptosporangium sp. NPDC051023]|uniref:hypothetical protein n=1 Tax=Streptosporangium sp. NPDC051023 TaxID=3155410 RepID=UPI0034506CDA
MLKIVRGTPSAHGSREGAVPQEQDEVLSYLGEVLADARGANGRADRKAIGLLVAAVLCAVAAGMWKPQELPSQVEWLWWTGGFFCVMGILMFGAALHPLSAGFAGRTVERRRSYAGRLHAWRPPAADADAGVAQGGRSRGAFSEEALAELRARMRGQDTRISADMLVLRIRRLSAVAHAKNRYIRRGLLLLLVAAVCCLLSVTIGQALLGG